MLPDRDPNPADYLSRLSFSVRPGLTPEERERLLGELVGGLLAPAEADVSVDGSRSVTYSGIDAEELDELASWLRGHVGVFDVR
jgi:hypothetical protein